MKLDYRVVYDWGGFKVCKIFNKIEMSNSAKSLLSDLQTVGNNLGFTIQNTEDLNNSRHKLVSDIEWEPGKLHDVMCSYKNETIVLFSTRAYKKGTTHIKFNTKFLETLNVEFGRLKGWIKSKEEAALELGMDIDDVNSSFNTNVQIKTNNIQLLN